MRRLGILVALFLVTGLGFGQDWAVANGVEYNCEAIRAILDEWGDEPLTRQSGSQVSVQGYFAEVLTTCPDPISVIPTEEAESIQTEDEGPIVDTSIQGAGDDCYPHDDAIVTRDTTVKTSYGFTQATVGLAKVGDTFEVIGSRKYVTGCWVATKDGWLFGGYVRATEADTLAVTQDLETDAREAQETCYPYSDAIVTRDTTLRRNSYTVASPHDERARVGNTFDVLGSKQFLSNCWVETTAGWLIATAIKPSDPVLVADSPASCHQGRTAYLTGRMNIRRQATVASEKTGVAEAGQSFEVTEAHQGENWCWLKISKGWMADTKFVSYDIIDVLPPISGEDWFKDKIVRAFEFLSSKSTRWFNYTVPKIQAIRPDPDLETNARVIAPTGKVTVGTSFIRRIGRDFAMLASTLVHEACHVHQWESGKRSFLGWDLEKECYTLEATALSQISPRHPDVEALRCWGKHYPITSLCTLDWNW